MTALPRVPDQAEIDEFFARQSATDAQAEAIREGLKKVPRGSTFSLTDEAAELLKQSDARREQAAE